MLALSLLLSLSAFAQNALYEEYPVLADAHGSVRVSSLVTGDGTLFQQLVEGASTRTYEEFLDLILLLEPRLFRNHLLLHHSQSLQPASREHPRVILFHRGTMLAFVETPGRIDREVEMLGWDPAARRFQAAELRFKSPSETGVARNNPPECAACHGAALKPIWLPYDFWPGAYGANIGRTLTLPEKQSLDSFMDRTQREPRRSVYSRLDFSLTQRGPRSAQLQGVEIFTEFVGQLNAQFEIDRIDPAVVPALAGISGHCVVKPSSASPASSVQTWLSHWDAFVPPAFHGDRSELQRRVLAYQARRGFQKQRLLERYRRQFPLGEMSDLPYMPDRLAAEWGFSAFRELLLERLDQPLELGTSPFELPGILTLPLNGEMLWASLLATHPDLGRPHWVKRIFEAPLGYPHKVLEWAQVDCQTLAAESRARLSRLAPEGASALRVSSPLGRCAQCHSIDPEGAGAPRIPFDEPVELSAWLRNPTRRLSRKIHARVHRRGPGQMPPDEPLSASEVEALETALERIREL